ncbi:MAG: hypothetical protein QM811_25565 [Pirellulales bacterium]
MIVDSLRCFAKLCVTPMFVGSLCVASYAAAAETDDASPDERLHALLFERKDVSGRSYPHMVDPPLWPLSNWPLEDEGHRALLKLFDELAAADMSQAAWTPRRRALARREVRQIFDWTFEGNHDEEAKRETLRRRATAAMRRLALTAEQIAALPANLNFPTNVETPPHVRDAQAGWVTMQLRDDERYAHDHRARFGERSAFVATFRHPAGRVAAEAYFKLLAATEYPPKRADSGIGFFEHRGIPEFPLGTQVGLLRTAVLIDAGGASVASPLVENLQVRTFLKIDDPTKQDHMRTEEYALDRASYLRDRTPRLHAVGPEDDEPIVFRSHGDDPFEAPERRTLYPKVLRACADCHRDRGAASLLGFTRALSIPLDKNPAIRVGTFDDEVKRNLRLDDKDEKARAAKLRELWQAEK